MKTRELTALGHPQSEIKYTLDKPVTFRRKLSPNHLMLPGAYRTTAWVEVKLPWSESGRFPRLEIARFSSSTPGHVDVFASQTEQGIVSEITHAEFSRLIRKDASSSFHREETHQ